MNTKPRSQHMTITGLPHGATLHSLKILPEFYWEVRQRKKTFEIRRNDREFKVGDTVCLDCWSEEIGYHDAPTLYASIGYITSFQQKEDYVVFSINVWAER